jgi:hypothetical protein
VQKKQEDVLEKIKQKRAKSLMAGQDTEVKKEEVKSAKKEEGQPASINITQIKPDTASPAKPVTQESPKLQETPVKSQSEDHKPESVNGEASPGKPEVAECRAP